MAENNTQWKQKYYTSLDNLEQREKECKQLENLFKQAISRLSLAAEGNNKSLDNDLKQLRAAIRTGKDNDFIETILEHVSRDIIKLDKQEKSESTGAAHFLLKIIEQMQPQGKAEKISRCLVKQIKSENPPQQKELLNNFSELLSEVIKQTIIDNDKEQNSSKAGFLNSFFSSAGESSADHKKHESNLNQQQMNSVVHTVQNVLESIIDGLELTSEIKGSLKNKLNEIEPTKEIHVLLDNLTEILEDNSRIDAGAGAGIIEKPKDDDKEEHHVLLLRLIEYLPLDESIKEKVEQLKENFSHGVNTEQLPRALRSIADLISNMHSNVHQEQKEFEVFLKNLTGRLESVDQYLQNNFQKHRRSYQEGIELDNVVKQQLKGIGKSIASKDSLETIESTIQVSLQQIVTHLDLHRLKEDERAAQLEAQNNELSEQLKILESKSSALRKQVLESSTKALTDPLTQLPNRLAYNQRLKQEYARWKRYNNTLLIMIWDIDYFKKVNDTYGHQAGDKVLKVVAGVLHTKLRETDFVSRFGGEEFVSIMPETSLGGGFKIAEKMRSAVEKLEFQYHGDNVKVTISCGVTLFMENDTPETAFERADKALYQAKKQGRNRCVIAKEV